VIEAIVSVLQVAQQPLPARDVHAAVEALRGEPVNWSTVKNALSTHARADSGRIYRVAHGRYAARLT
jgi:hypothetical protein